MGATTADRPRRSKVRSGAAVHEGRGPALVRAAAAGHPIFGTCATMRMDAVSSSIWSHGLSHATAL